MGFCRIMLPNGQMGMTLRLLSLPTFLVVIDPSRRQLTQAYSNGFFPMHLLYCIHSAPFIKENYN